MTSAPLASSADDVLASFLDVLVTFDATALMPLMGPDPVLEFPYATGRMPSVVRGRGDVERFWHTMNRSFAHMRAHDVELYPMVEPTLAMVRWRSEAVTATTARAYRNRYVSIARIENGLVHWYCEYFDPLVVLGAFDIPEHPTTSTGKDHGRAATR